MNVVHRINEGYQSLGALKSEVSNRGLGINVKKCLDEGVIVPTVLCGVEAWSTRSAEKRKVNKKVLYSMTMYFPVENLLPQFVGSIINQLQCNYDTEVSQWQ